MGKTTYDSIGNALPNRRNIVLAPNLDLNCVNCEVFNSFEAALAALEEETEVMIIGGESVYRQALAFADTIYLTIVHHNFTGDRHFPELDPNEWQEVNRQDFHADKDNPYPYSFVTLIRQTP